MATTRNIGQILIDKAQEIDPSFKPDKFNDAGDALDIVLKNVSIPSYQLIITGAEWVLQIKGISYNDIKNEKYGFETKLIQAAQQLSKQTFKDAEEARTWIIDNWKNLQDFHGLLFATLIDGLRDRFYNATVQNNTTTLTSLIMVNEDFAGNILGIGSNDGTTLTPVYNLLTDTQTSFGIVWFEDGGTCLKDW